MSLQDTIKSIEEADEKLSKAIIHEDSAIAYQREAAKFRDESKAILEQTTLERQKLEALQDAKAARLERQANDLKNREATLAAGKADLERQTIETNKRLDSRENALAAREVALENNEQAVKEHKKLLDELALKYTGIAKYITDRV